MKVTGKTRIGTRGGRGYVQVLVGTLYDHTRMGSVLAAMGLQSSDSIKSSSVRLALILIITTSTRRS